MGGVGPCGERGSGGQQGRRVTSGGKEREKERDDEGGEWGEMGALDVRG